jgi:hypothetical protein
VAEQEKIALLQQSVLQLIAIIPNKANLPDYAKAIIEQARSRVAYAN